MRKEAVGIRKVTKINFGSATYDVVYTEKLMSEDESQRLRGQINYQKCRVEVDPELDDRRLASTLIHESVHFFLSEYGQDTAVNPQRMEDLVTAVSTGVQLLIRLNPDLVEFVQETG